MPAVSKSKQIGCKRRPGHESRFRSLPGNGSGSGRQFPAQALGELPDVFEFVGEIFGDFALALPGQLLLGQTGQAEPDRFLMDFRQIDAWRVWAHGGIEDGNSQFSRWLGNILLRVRRSHTKGYDQAER